MGPFSFLVLQGELESSVSPGPCTQSCQRAHAVRTWAIATKASPKEQECGEEEETREVISDEQTALPGDLHLGGSGTGAFEGDRWLF